MSNNLRKSKPSIRQTAAVAAVAMLPTAAVFVLLVATGRLDLGDALMGGCAAFGAFALLAWAGLGRLDAVRRHLDHLPNGEEESLLVEAGFGPIAALARSAGRLGGRIRQQRSGLEANAALAEAVSAVLPAPVLLLDGNARVLVANAAAVDFFERDPEGVDLAAVLRDPGVLDAVRAVLGGASARDVDFLQPVPVERSLCAMIRPLPAVDRSNAAALLLLEDFTAIKRTDQMRADFVANVGHELKTPLSSLIGFIETLQGPAAEDGVARERFLSIMHDQAGRMARMIEDLLSLSRIELEEHTPPTNQVALAPVLQDLAEALQPQAGAKDMHFELELPAEVPDIVGDPDQVTQVFENLFDNAVKYGHPGTAIRVGLTIEEGSGSSPGADGRGAARVAVTVSDTGDGIPEDQLARLTERFYRVDQARSRQLGGTGLGLAIVKHIVNRHRGSLDIASTVGQGSTFTVRIPAAT